MDKSMKNIKVKGSINRFGCKNCGCLIFNRDGICVNCGTKKSV